MTTQLANSITVTAESRRQQALELRIQGNYYSQIADKIGISLSRAHELVQEALEALRESNAEKAGQVRDIELARLDGLLFALWPDRAKPRTADTILRISQRRSDLLGLDAPKNIKIGGDGAPLRHTFDLSQLSTDELLQLETLTAKSAARTETPLLPARASANLTPGE